MVSLQHTPTTTVLQEPPIVGALQTLFNNLPDADLLIALQGPTRRGPKGHAIQALWRAFITKHYMGLGCTRELIRTLSNNPWIATPCGFDWPNVPHEATFSRFFARISLRKYQHLLKDVSRALVRRHYRDLPGFGQRVALDATVLKGWSNGGKQPKADTQAGWAVKQGTQGTKEYTYGWKLHLLADCESEMPIAANVSAGNVHDSKRASNVLSEARRTYSRFHPQFVMADKGYATKALFGLIRRQYGSQPVIDLRVNQTKMAVREGKQRSLPGFKALYLQRQAVERAFSRLKGQRSLNSITVRGRMKVTTHCYLALIAMQISAFSGSVH